MKDVFLVMLMTVAAVLGVILILAMPLLVSLRGEEAGKALPDEVRESFPQRFGKLRVNHVWAAYLAAKITGALLKWWGFPEAKAALDWVCLPLFLVGFGWNVVWAGRVLLRRAELDGRLVKFAHYRFWPSLAVVVLLAACYASGF